MDYLIDDGDYEYIISYNKCDRGFIDIYYRYKSNFGYEAWLHKIRDGKLVLRADHKEQTFRLPDHIINQINKIIKLKLFL